MGFIKKLFGFKDKQKDYEAVVTGQEGNRMSIDSIRQYKEEACGLCKQPIAKERYKNVNDYLVHKRCFKKMRRDIFNGKR